MNVNRFLRKIRHFNYKTFFVITLAAILTLAFIAFFIFFGYWWGQSDGYTKGYSEGWWSGYMEGLHAP